MSPHGEPVGSLSAFLASVSGGDTPDAAVAASRCLRPPIGCGRDLVEGDFNRNGGWLYAREWRITGLCPTCQDALDEPDGEE